MGKAAEKFDTYLLFDPDDIAYEFESDVPFTGTAINWHDNGQKRAETAFVGGKREGIQREWRKSEGDSQSTVQLIGTLEWLSHYKDNELHGEVASYRKSGIKVYSTTYENGKDVGPTIYYDKNGTIESKNIYDGDELQKVIWFSKDGKKTQEREYVDGEPGDVVLFYNEDGEKEYELHMVPGTEEESHIVVFDEEGNPHEWKDETTKDKFMRFVTYTTNIIGALLIGMIAFKFVIRWLLENEWIAG